MNILWQLFTSFSRIGAFTFGGGYAMLPLLQQEVVEKRGWSTEDEILDYFAIGQCTPGIIFVNTATFVGYKQKGVLGAIFATLGAITPSIIIVMIISSVLNGFADLPVVQHAFGAIRVVVGVLIYNAVSGMWKKSVVDKLCVCVVFVAFFIATCTTISPAWIVFGATVFGLFLGKMGYKGGAKQ
ncbi:chromate transporter [Chakrabartyella piscis]|uniref:chromate transporter n=1 Tax=Chakrabartyella piscis TaxID=2918914 RepID=UPI002958C315|nr:chromate transporter [Chakrabartyella piscis]